MAAILSRRELSQSEHAQIQALRNIWHGTRSFTVPSPRLYNLAIYGLFLLVARVMSVLHFSWRIFVCEPIFKAQCKEYGKGVRTDIYVHTVSGKGDIILGDDVLIDGKCVFGFAARYSDAPTLTIGSHTKIGHQCRFTVGDQIQIGKHCLIASETLIFDAPGHPLNPDARQLGMPSMDADVRPVVIEDNVWIGRRSIIYPGVTIGQGSVIASGSVVTADVPPFTIVAGNPARQVQSLSGHTHEFFLENIPLRETGPIPKADSWTHPVQETICRVGKLKHIGMDDTLAESGFSSLYFLKLMMELEMEQGITIPDDRFIQVRTPRDIDRLIESLKQEQAV